MQALNYIWPSFSIIMSIIGSRSLTVCIVILVLLGSTLSTLAGVAYGQSVGSRPPNLQQTFRQLSQQFLNPLGLDTSTRSVSQASQSPTPVEVINETGPPLQRAIKDALARLEAEGKPHPTANFTSTISIPEFGNTLTIKGTTVLSFTGPGEAGKDKWDDLIVQRPTSGTGTIGQTGNLTQRAIDMFPQIYGPGPCPNNTCFTYGTEPRVYTIPENFTVTFAPRNITLPPPINVTIPPLSAVNIGSQDPTTTGNVLMGFSFARHIDWSVGSSACVDLGIFGRHCLYEIRVGFLLDYGIGLRLPARVDINGPASMIIQHTYSTLTTSLTPVNFSASDYANIGLPGNEVFNGHEFEARFNVFLGIVAEVLGFGINWSINPSVDLGQACSNQLGRNCQDFVTPFGVDTNGNPIQFPFNGATVKLTPDETGIKVDFAGAGLGVGLGVSFSLGPASRITADWSATGAASGSGAVTYTAASPIQYNLGTITTNNANLPGQDSAIITLQNFKYFFSTLTLGFCADLEFTGWLSFVGGTPCKDIYTLTLNISDLSLHQHDGTPGVTANIPVTDFSLQLTINPSTLSIIPGSTGTYVVTAKNTGTSRDTFDDFQLTGLPSSWGLNSAQTAVTLDPGAATSFNLGITPLRSFTTAVGDYPFTVTMESQGARANGLTRIGSASAIVHVLPFRQPRVQIQPSLVEIKPGQTATYTITVQNNGNVPDSVSLSISLLDFGTAFRAVPTAIDPSWTLLSKTTFGPLNPGQTDTASYSVTVPAGWQGVENTVYQFKATTTSASDPTAAGSDTGSLRVLATKESIARFIDTEINSLMRDVSVSTIPPDVKSTLLGKLGQAETKKEQALTYILAGRSTLANNMLGSASNVMSSFISFVTAQKNKTIPSGLADNWTLRAQVIVSDLQAAIAAGG